MPRTAYELGVGECSAMEQKARTKAKRKSKGGSKEAVNCFKKKPKAKYFTHCKPIIFSNENGSLDTLFVNGN